MLFCHGGCSHFHSSPYIYANHSPNLLPLALLENHSFCFRPPPTLKTTMSLVSVALLFFLFLNSNEICAVEEITQGADQTPLQKHVSFFDRNKDGLIYPKETFQGFRAIGCGVALSTAAATLINGALHVKTKPEGSLPNPLLPIYVSNIHKGKHGSDSGVYDTEGRFVAEKFEDIFLKHAHTDPNYLTSDELQEMLKANRQPNDVPGWSASSAEWKVFYDLGKDEKGLLQKETIRAVYDGSLFYQLEAKASAKKKSQ